MPVMKRRLKTRKSKRQAVEEIEENEDLVDSKPENRRRKKSVKVEEVKEKFKKSRRKRSKRATSSSDDTVVSNELEDDRAEVTEKEEAEVPLKKKRLRAKRGGEEVGPLRSSKSRSKKQIEEGEEMSEEKTSKLSRKEKTRKKRKAEKEEEKKNVSEEEEVGSKKRKKKVRKNGIEDVSEEEIIRERNEEKGVRKEKQEDEDVLEKGQMKDKDVNEEDKDADENKDINEDDKHGSEEDKDVNENKDINEEDKHADMKQIEDQNAKEKNNEKEDSEDGNDKQESKDNEKQEVNKEVENEEQEDEEKQETNKEIEDDHDAEEERKEQEERDVQESKEEHEGQEANEEQESNDDTEEAHDAEESQESKEQETKEQSEKRQEPTEQLNGHNREETARESTDSSKSDDRKQIILPRKSPIINSSLFPIFTFLPLEFDLVNDDNYFIIKPNLRNSIAMKLACVILFKDTATPSISALQRRINLMGQWVSPTNPELKMATTDIHSARGVVCMGRNNTIFYGPYEHAISIAPPEAPQIQSRVIETTPVSVELYVTTSQECKVWCLPVLASDEKKTVDEVKAGTFRFVRNRVSLFFQGLKPQTQYDIWCYGETKNGVPSDDLITARAETKSGRSHFPVSFVVEFKVILEDVTQNLISFSLENNLRQDARCLLLDDSSNQVRTTNVKYQKNTPVHFSGLNSHSLYYIRCEVTAKEKGRNTVNVLAETGLVPVKTTRSFLSSLLLSLFFIALFTLVLAVVLFIVRSRSNGFLNK